MWIWIVALIVIIYVIFIAVLKIASMKNRRGKVTYFQDKSSVERPNNVGAISSDSCRSCGKQLQKGATFCSYCGSNTMSSNTCTNCGRQLQQGARYCPFCGHSI